MIQILGQDPIARVVLNPLPGGAPSNVCFVCEPGESLDQKKHGSNDSGIGNAEALLTDRKALVQGYRWLLAIKVGCIEFVSEASLADLGAWTC